MRRYSCETVRRGRVGLLSDLRVWAGTLRLLGGRFPPLSPLDQLSAGGSSAVHLDITARARCAAAVRGSFVWEEGAEVQPRHAFLHVPPVRQNLLVAPPGDRAVAAAPRERGPHSTMSVPHHENTACAPPPLKHHSAVSGRYTTCPEACICPRQLMRVPKAFLSVSALPPSFPGDCTRTQWNNIRQATDLIRIRPYFYDIKSKKKSRKATRCATICHDCTWKI